MARYSLAISLFSLLLLPIYLSVSAEDVFKSSIRSILGSNQLSLRFARFVNSVTGSLEATYAQSYGKNISLSEQQLVDCSCDFGNVGCDGGWPPQAFDYIKSVGGLETECSYPYTDSNGTCKFSPKRVSPVKLVHYVNISTGDEDELRHAVELVQPVTVAFQVVEDFMSYNGGVYTSKTCNNTIHHKYFRLDKDVNHGGIAVGYGVEKNGMLYWIMKNSWGTECGENGYFRIEMGKNMCGVAAGAW